MRAVRGLLVVTLCLLVLPSGRAHAAYPPAGTDAFDSSAQVFVQPAIFGCEPGPLVNDVVLIGPTTVERSDPSTAGNLDVIDTEIVAMDLAGTGNLGPVIIRQDPDRRTLGRVSQQEPGLDFPADSFFDVFVEVELGLLPGVTLENLDPVRMESEIHSLPPHAFPYLPPPDTCIPLAVEGTELVLFNLIHAEHLPETQRACMPVPFGTSTVVVDDQPYNVGQMDGVLQIVRGKRPAPDKPIDTEMIELTLHGVTQDARQIVVEITEPPRIGSFGRTGLPDPLIDSFFDIFYEVRLGDGDRIAGGPLRIEGRLDPATGGTLSGASSRPPIVQLQVGIAPAVPCPDGSYPPGRD